MKTRLVVKRLIDFTITIQLFDKINKHVINLKRKSQSTSWDTLYNISRVQDVILYSIFIHNNYFNIILSNQKTTVS